MPLFEACEATHPLLHLVLSTGGLLHLHTAFTEEAETKEDKYLSQGFKASRSGPWTGTTHQFVQDTATL